MSKTVSEFPEWYVAFRQALLRQAPRPDEIDQVTADGWTSNQEALKKNLAGSLLPPSVATPALPSRPELLLDAVGTIDVPATTEQFVAKERFACDTGPEAKVKIVDHGAFFEERFIWGKGKIEDPIAAQKLRCHVLLEGVADDRVIAELGGVAKVETTLSELYHVMEKQGNGEEGDLFIDGSANNFYISDQNGELCVVSVRWAKVGWFVGAYPITDELGWTGGQYFFTRNPVRNPGTSVSV